MGGEQKETFRLKNYSLFRLSTDYSLIKNERSHLIQFYTDSHVPLVISPTHTGDALFVSITALQTFKSPPKD